MGGTAEGITYDHTTALPRRTVLAYQPLSVRVVAHAIDWVLAVIVEFAVFILLGTPIYPDAPLPTRVLLTLPFFVGGYLIATEAIWGASLGKRLLGTVVRMADGRTPTVGACVVRNLARAIDAFPYVVPYGVGMVLIKRSFRRQRLGDRWAGTVVVSRAALDMNEERSGPPSEALRRAQMGQEEYEAYLRKEGEEGRGARVRPPAGEAPEE